MRNFINIVEAKTASFELARFVRPDRYEITDSLSGISRWRAYTYEANSGGTVGEMDKVGYVMISLRDNTILPIAHGDEHHTGYDIMYDFNCMADDYLPLCDGNNYIYGRKDIPKYLNAIQKWLSYGGRDLPLYGTNDLRNVAVLFSDFVKLKGNVEIRPDELSPMGQQIVNLFDDMATALRNSQNLDRIQARPIFVKAAQTAKTFLVFWSRLPTDALKLLKTMPEMIKQYQRENDLQGLTELFFGFHGLKNTIHNDLRRLKQDGSGHYFDNAKAVWGDLDLAIDRLGRY